MEYVAAAFKNVFDRKDSIKKGVKIIKEAPVLRHFTVELERL
jgi:tryptophanase